MLWQKGDDDEFRVKWIDSIRSSHLWWYARLTSFTGKNSFEIQIRKRRLISISKDFLLKNEVRRAYYHTWEERIGMLNTNERRNPLRRRLPQTNK